MKTIGVLKEESRVALAPTGAASLIKKGYRVLIQNQAGVEAFFGDEDYEKVGASIELSDKKIMAESNILLRIQPFTPKQITSLKKDTTVIGFLNPFDEKTHNAYHKHCLRSYAFEKMPRISRFQSIDALSSQANIAGYQAVLEGARLLKKVFPMMTTSAGSIYPVRLMVIGIGVLGLQAIATAKRLGAVVYGYDIRPETKEQVESLGGVFIGNKDAYHEHLKKTGIVITAAQVLSKKAPIIIDTMEFSLLKKRSVIIDTAIQTGGNCIYSKIGEEIIYDGITIYAPASLPSMLSHDASHLISQNFCHFIQFLEKNDPDLEQCIV